MIVGIMGNNSSTGEDFSWVKDEVYNLADVPRDFDEDLYRKFGVSNTVIDYWKEIDYKPPYYYLFWLFHRDAYKYNFEEFRTIRDRLIAGVCKENEKLGNALLVYATNEDGAYEKLVTSDENFMYSLSYEFDDGSGSTLLMSVDYDQIISRMNDEIKNEGDDVEYYVYRYPVFRSDETGDITGIDVEDSCGKLTFDRDGILKYFDGTSDFVYDGQDSIELLYPYIFFPHPFVTGDVVKMQKYDEEFYGVLAYAADIDERKGDRPDLNRDGSDFSATIEMLYQEENENRYRFGHDHICPLFFEKVDVEKDIEQERLKYLLSIASEIEKGETPGLSGLSYYMG